MIKIYNYKINKLIREGIIKEVVKLSTNSKYEKNKSYWCGYWDQYFTVLSVEYRKDNHLRYVSVRWEDGRETTHKTELNPSRDYEVVIN